MGNSKSKMITINVKPAKEKTVIDSETSCRPVDGGDEMDRHEGEENSGIADDRDRHEELYDYSSNTGKELNHDTDVSLIAPQPSPISLSGGIDMGDLSARECGDKLSASARDDLTYVDYEPTQIIRCKYNGRFGVHKFLDNIFAMDNCVDGKSVRDSKDSKSARDGKDKKYNIVFNYPTEWIGYKYSRLSELSNEVNEINMHTKFKDNIDSDGTVDYIDDLFYIIKLKNGKYVFLRTDNDGVKFNVYVYLHLSLHNLIISLSKENYKLIYDTGIECVFNKF